MFCGSFSQVEDNDPWSLGSSPKRSRRRGRNPYSNRGLDKFSRLLADLEARREKIMAQIGDVTLVRFMYSNSQDWVPIVVRLRDPKMLEKTRVANPPDRKQAVAENHHAAARVVVGAKENKPIALPSASASSSASDVGMIIKKSFSWGVDTRGRFSWRSSRRSNCYWAVAFIVILVCLVLFGRSFAILCTSVWWYLVPTLQAGEGGNAKRSSMKKEYVRRLSGKKLAAAGDVRSHQLKLGTVEAASTRGTSNAIRK